MINIILQVFFVVLIMALVVLSLWCLFLLLIRIMSLTTDFFASRVIRGRNIFIGHDGNYEMVVDFLKCYFAGLGAVITDIPPKAEFQLVLNQDAKDQGIIICRLRDECGNTKTLREGERHWPKPLAMALANFIRKNDRRLVKMSTVRGD